MTNPNDQRLLLAQALNGVKVRENPSLKQVFGLEELGADVGVFRTLFFGPNSIAVEISEEAALHLLDLANSMRRNDARLTRAASPNRLVDVIGDHLAAQLHKNGSQADLSLEALKKGIEEWVAARTETRTYFVPCRIMPARSPAFAIGPVSFCHLDDFDFPTTDDVLDTTRRFRDYLEQVRANWIASVIVPDREPVEAERVADAAVDIALAGLQAMANVDEFDLIGRCSASRPPSYRMAVSSSLDGRIAAGYQHHDPGRAVEPAEFERLTQSDNNLFPAMGRCINSLLTGNSPTPALDAAWGEAAYLYHEALTHPFPTLQAARFETCLEVLLSAESTSGSKSRLMDAFDKLLVLPAGHIVERHRNLTAEKFVKSVVEARSRVLHGTWSTFSHDLPNVTAASIRRFARVVLINFAAALADYREQPNVADDLDDFLDWAAAKTVSRRAARTGAPGPATP